MKLSDAEQLQLQELCHAMLDGVADAAQRAGLQRWLASSEEARRLYVRTAALSASLFEYAGEMQSEEPEFVPAYFQVHDRRFWWVSSALAAAVALALWWSGAARHPRTVTGIASAPAAEAEEVVARLSGAKDCRWTSVAVPAGEELHRGQQMQLAAGVAEIAFDSGAVVTLEGPATLELTSAWEAVLHYGTLKALVPHEAIGFRVTNPEVEVVDLGTEFSMVAEQGGGTEVFVTKGAVETRGGGTQEPLVLRETQARRFAKAGASEVRDREQKMRRLARVVELERVVKPLGYLHWSFDGAGTDAAQAVGLPAQTAEALFTGTAAPLPGRYGEALAFDGHTSGKVKLSAFASEEPRAAAFWVKLPADAQISEEATLLAWRGSGEEPRVEIGWNRQPAHGPVGAVRVEVGRGFVVGTTPLRDGRWHHLAFVLGAGKKETRFQPRLYVDGRLESIAGRHGGLHREKHPEGHDSTLLIGRTPAAEAAFRGALDELYLTNRPLTPQEIRNLMELNRPADGTIAAR